MSTSQALVLAAHGSQLSPDAAIPAFTHADHIWRRGIFNEVTAAFWKEEPALHTVLSTLDSDFVVVVPLMMSDGYFASDVFPRELDIPTGREVNYTPPVGTHPLMTDVIVQRAATIIDREETDSDVGLALIGHGTERNLKSAASTRYHADKIRELRRFSEVRTAFLDESPYVDSILSEFSAESVAVVPLFVADGRHTTIDIPESIGIPRPIAGHPTGSTIDGTTVWYAGAVGTEPLLAELIIDRAIEAGIVINQFDGTTSIRCADQEFLTWITDHDSLRSWGELAVIPTTTGRYELRHFDDHDVPQSALNELSGPEEVRDRIRHDDSGDYRPLRGACSLPTTWIATDLSPSQLIRAVRYVYPASITAWYAERTGELDPVQWDDVANRQTGAYESIQTVSDTQIEQTITACCSDCVKRRTWDAGSTSSPDSDTDEHVIPCRAPCSFFVSAAHAFQDVDDDGVRYKPDPDVPVGALGTCGNRYRERYRRALNGTRVARTEVS